MAVRGGPNVGVTMLRSTSFNDEKLLVSEGRVNSSNSKNEDDRIVLSGQVGSGDRRTDAESASAEAAERVARVNRKALWGVLPPLWVLSFISYLDRTSMYS